MIHYFDVHDLKETFKAKLLSGEIEVYDVVHSFIKKESKIRYSQHKYLGNSIVFSHGRRNKILIYGRGVYTRVRDLKTGKLVEYVQHG